MGSFGKFWINIFTNKCPKCAKGKVWQVNALKALWNKKPMDTHCSHCGLKFEREPGFWQGAMYVSYGLSAGIFIVCWFVIEYFLPHASTGQILVILLGSSILLAPINWRWSRLIWLNAFTNSNTILKPSEIEKGTKSTIG